MPRAVVISNGFAHDYKACQDLIKGDDFIICADGGIKHLLSMDMLPDLWIGDFDSCKHADLLEKYPDLRSVDTLVLKKDKDETDTHFCCIKALEMGYSDIAIMFAGGGRIDHMLSNIHLLEYISKRGAAGTIYDEKNTISLCTGSITIPKQRKYLSIIPLDSEVVVHSTKGLLYPLKDFALPREISMGVSNEITDKTAEINLKLGLALIVESDD